VGSIDDKVCFFWGGWFGHLQKGAKCWGTRIDDHRLREVVTKDMIVLI